MVPAGLVPVDVTGAVSRQYLGRPGPSPRAVAAAISVIAGLAVLSVATLVFPHHSANHDEAVYLLQAEMLLNGQLELHAGTLAEAFRPWFFVLDGGRLYPKYAPVPAAVFAVGIVLGEPRIALGLVAAGNVALVYVVGAAAVDRWTGVLAAGLLLASPMFLLTSSVFLPYAPTTLLTLAFALAYVRAVRRRDRRYAALAGVAIGLAFFARPYTAVLFAAPFAAHALWRARWAIRRDPRDTAVVRAGIIGVVVLGLVGLALAYNVRLVGAPLAFPYEALAPRDGLGFGRREILGHGVVYTPELAAHTTAHVLWELLTRWGPVGAVGTALVGIGVARFLRAVRVSRSPWTRPNDSLSPLGLQALLLGLLISVTVGNAYFWGSFNTLGDLADPADGLASLFGPFYHFDLLIPLSVFAANGTMWIVTRLRRGLRARLPAREARVLLAVVLVTGLAIGAAAEANALGPPVERHLSYTDRYERAYAPFESADFDGALVFLPTPYGPWLGHPFQSLRNEPGLDGDVVYAIDRDPAGDFAVLDAYPDRELYRYRFHGRWTTEPDGSVVGTLERLRVREAASVSAETTVGIPGNVESAWVRVSTNKTAATYEIVDSVSCDRLTVSWTIAPGGVRISGPALDHEDREVIPIAEVDEVALAVTLVAPDGSTLTYREEAPVEVLDGTVRVIWPPETRLCRLTTDCGSGGTYLADHPESRPDGTWVETALSS